MKLALRILVAILLSPVLIPTALALLIVAGGWFVFTDENLFKRRK
jgi:hypothetical protein